MKKIIAAFDGLKFSESTKEYAIHISKLSNAHIVGVFLDDATYTSYKIYDLVTNEGTSARKMRDYDAKDKSARDKAVINFENACRIAGLNYSIHHDRNVALQELLHESIYADLLVIDRKETLTHDEEAVPTSFIKDLLADVQCPVLLAPSEFKHTEKLVFLYDGEPSSVQAVRMYSYLFPVHEQTDVEVISVLSNDNTLHMPDNHLMKEFMKRHYGGATYKILKGIPEEEIVNNLREQSQNTTIVLGAYRRGRVSRWFRPSMADVLMKELKSPLFIAHTK
jgi:nucleotide-binding universal stress UspA family protein